MAKKALLVVDMQNDFISGSLGTSEAVSIVPNVVNRIKEALNYNEDLYFTLDTHYDDYLNTLEGKHLPVVHCIEGTIGHEVHKDIKEYLDKAKKIFIKNGFGYVGIDKELNNYDEITIVGLCTDICVITQAILLKAGLKNTEIYVDEKCCAGVNSELHKSAIKTMASCQINII